MPDIHPYGPHTHCPTLLHGPLVLGLRSSDQVPTGHVITASPLWSLTMPRKKMAYMLCGLLQIKEEESVELYLPEH